MLCLDLDEASTLFDSRWLWSTRRMAPARFCRNDYLGDPTTPLADAVRDLVAERLDRAPNGPIRLLAQPRYFGLCFNPIAIYFCYEPGGQELDALVLEVTNTPWGERRAYLLDARCAERVGGRLCFEFDKQMHVSPFVPMEITYRLSIGSPGSRLNVQLDALDRTGQTVVDATLVLERRPISGRSLAWALARYPWMTAQILLAIYFEAARLWWKGAPLFDHPHSTPSDLQDAHA